MPNEREISNEQILYLLIHLREEDARRDSFRKIVVNREQSRAIGLFNYQIKETGKKRASQLFLIKEDQDGDEVNVIYDDKGRFVAWESFDKQGKRKTDLEVSNDIELNKENLIRQIQLEDERTRESTKKTNNGTSKAGEGRDLPKEQKEKQHEIEKEKNKITTHENKNIEEGQKNKLENLKGEINIDYVPKTRLDQIINGYHLWDILQIEDKLQGRLPEGLSEKSFRNGYLTIIDSKQLEAKDGKTRPAADTFAVCTQSGDIIELDEQVLEPQNLGTREERMIQENKRQRYADGKEVRKPDEEFDLTRTSKWKIPNADSRFAVNEEWYLGVDINRSYKEDGSRPMMGHIKEISFIQEPRETDKTYSKDSAEARTRESLEYKLEDIAEPPLSEKEQKQMEQLRKKDSNEAISVRKEHREEFEKLVDELTGKYGDYYNRRDMEKKVEKYHNEGMDIEEIKEQVKEDAGIAEEIEHEFHIHG